MGSSIRTGVHALQHADGWVVMTCDMPAVTATHLKSLMAADELTASLYGQRLGVPAYFPANLFERLMQLSGDIGGRELLASAKAVALPLGELDIDTLEDLEEARRICS